MAEQTTPAAQSASTGDHPITQQPPYRHHPNPLTTVLPILQHFLPQSLPLYNRIKHPFHNPSAGVYASFAPDLPQHLQHDKAALVPQCFAVAFVDRSMAPETEAWIFVSGSVEGRCGCAEAVGMEGRRLDPVEWRAVEPLPGGGGDGDGDGDGDGGLVPCEVSLRRVLGLVKARARARAQREGDGEDSGMKIGTVSGFEVMLLRRWDVLDLTYPGLIPYVKFVFDVDDVKQAKGTKGGVVGSVVEIDDDDDDDAGEKKQMVTEWGSLTLPDLNVVISRTHIPRKPQTLARMKSVAVFARSKDNPDEDVVPVAWAFLGLDGSLSTLHVEPAYRGLGLAKLIAGKLLRDEAETEGGSRWGHADVAIGNGPSEGVCSSLGGKRSWVVWWVVVRMKDVR